jgi:GTP1/Obg family GTP-binding protein
MDKQVNIHGLITQAKEKSAIKIEKLDKEKLQIQNRIKELYSELETINKEMIDHERMQYFYNDYFDEPVTLNTLKKEMKILKKYLED